MLYELSTGETPWGSHKDEMTVFKIITAHSPGNLAVPESVSPNLSELIGALLHPLARDRLELAGVKSHAWFSGMQWARLLGAELPSPLQGYAEEKRISVSEEPEELAEDTFLGTDTEEWLSGFDQAADED